MTDKYQEANKRWRESSPEAKEKSNRLKMRSTARSFIRNRATLEDIKELRTMLNVQESLLKIKELKERIDRSRHGFPQINIYDKKADLVKVFMNSIIEEEEDMNDFNKWVDGLIGRFADDEPIIEIDLGNGEPQYFAADEWDLIDEYTN
jgi:hypothetical protein